MVWVTHIKTTLDIDDRLLLRAKRHAASQGTTLRAVVEDALRARLAPRPAARAQFGVTELLTEDRDFGRFTGLAPQRLTP